MNALNQELRAIQTSRQYLKQQLKKETNEHIQEKIKHYIDGLNKDEERLLKVLDGEADK